MRVEINALFRAHPLTGTGQHLEHLVAALRAGYPDIAIVERTPGRRLRGRVGKVWWEQVAWPAAACCSGAVLHAPHLAPPVAVPQTIVTAHDASCCLSTVLADCGGSTTR